MEVCRGPTCDVGVLRRICQATQPTHSRASASYALTLQQQHSCLDLGILLNGCWQQPPSSSSLVSNTALQLSWNLADLFHVYTYLFSAPMSGPPLCIQRRPVQRPFNVHAGGGLPLLPAARRASLCAGTADKDTLVRARATQHLSEAFLPLLKSGHQLQPVFEKLAAR